jgi:hypothetical protein
MFLHNKKGTGTGPDLNNSSVFGDEVHVHFMDHFFSGHEGSSMQNSEGGLLFEL